MSEFDHPLGIERAIAWKWFVLGFSRSGVGYNGELLTDYTLVGLDELFEDVWERLQTAESRRHSDEEIDAIREEYQAMDQEVAEAVDMPLLGSDDIPSRAELKEVDMDYVGNVPILAGGNDG